MTSETKLGPKVYTRTGDKGTTALFGGTRVGKDDLRLDAYGTLDELNTTIGILVSELAEGEWDKTNLEALAEIRAELNEMQIQIFNLGSHLATEVPRFREMLPPIDPQYVTKLENAMDRMSAPLTPLKHFVLPGGTKASSFAHLARAVARRAERATVVALKSTLELEQEAPEWHHQLITQVNRLNDYFFVLARFLNHLKGQNEPLWLPEKPKKKK